MDAILSLPLLSYLVLPSFGAYSTSLNLLFFYLTWATLVLSHPPITVEVVGTTAIRILFFIFPSLLFLLFDTLLPSLSRSLKTQGRRALPTQSLMTSRRGRGVTFTRPSRSNPPWYQVLGGGTLNILLGIILQAVVEHILTKQLRVRSALKVATALPFPWAIAKDLSRGFVVRELLQWTLHRYLLHGNPDRNSSAESLISPLATAHIQVHHAIKAPFSFVAHYDHPLAWIVWRWIPTYGAAAIFRFHLLTWFLFLGMVSVEESLSFSGYDLNSIITGGLARRQDLHMESGGQGNYGPWGVLDWIFGTSIGADISDDVRQEFDQHNGREKATRFVEGVKSGAREAAKSSRRGARKAEYD